MSTLASVIGRGVTGSRPANGIIGQLYYDTTLSQMLRDNGSSWDNAEGVSLYSAYLCYREEQASGTNAGTFTSGAWQTRVLNTEHADTANHGTLASNQVTLDAGTYRALINAPGLGCSTHTVKLYNVTDSADLLIGMPIYSNPADNGMNYAVAAGRFTIAGSKVLEVRHRGTATATTIGFGIAASFSVVEVYATLELWKE